MILAKSVHTAIAADDGLRVLATRFRGRGLSSQRYDVWLPALGPSEALLRSWQDGDLPWRDFARAYRAEIFEDGPVDARCRTIKNHGQKSTLRLLQTLALRGTVTVLCHCAEDERHCHRHELARLLGGRRL